MLLNEILAQTEDGYLLDVTKTELANLIGYCLSYEMKSKYTPKIGDKIEINKMYQQLYTLEHKQPELKKIVHTLRGLADLLEPVVPVIENVFIDCINEGDCKDE